MSNKFSEVNYVMVPCVTCLFSLYVCVPVI